MLSNKELWCIITGRSSLLQPVEIKNVLSENATKFNNGLGIYTKASATSDAKLKEDKAIKRKEFILKLSKLMNLDAVQTHDLFQNYIRSEFRGTGQQLQKMLEHELHIDALARKIASYYFQERILLLRCVKYLLSYWQDPACMFRAEFSAQVDEMVNQGFIDKILQQLKDLCNNGLIHINVKGNIPMERLHATQGLKEQCELLEIILLYHKDFEFSGEKMLDIAKFFQGRNYGLKQAEKRHLEASSNIIIDAIGFLNCLILLEAIDLETMSAVLKNQSSVEDHSLAANKELLRTLDGLLIQWDDFVQQSPVVLAWSLYRYYTKGDNAQIFEAFGRKAVIFDVFGYIHEMLTWISATSSLPVTNLAKSIIHSLLSHTLQVFHEDSFGDSQKIYKVAQEVIGFQEISDELFQKDSRNGIKMLLDSAQKRFPFTICPFLDLLTSTVVDLDSAENVFECVKNMKTFTELFGKNLLDEMQATDDARIWRRSCDKLLIGAGHDQIILPASSSGIIFDLPNDIRLVRWQVEYSGWEYLSLELDLIVSGAYDSTADSGEDVNLRITSIIKLLKAVIENDWSKAEDIEPMIACCFAVLKRLSNVSSPPLELLSICLETLILVAKHIPKQVFDQLNEIGFLPSCEEDRLQMHENRGPQISPGNYGLILTNTECNLGLYPVTKSYVGLLFELFTSHDPSLYCEELFQNFQANLVFLVEHIFGGFSRLKFAQQFEKEKIAESILEIFHILLAPQRAKELQEGQNRYSAHFKQIICQGLLYGEAGEALLHILSTGVHPINESLYEFASNENQRLSLIQVVKLALAVVDRLIISKQVTEATPLENAICTKSVMQPTDLEGLQQMEAYPLVNVIAKYIYHDYDPKLPTLAVIVLQKLCAVSPTSILASFGQDSTALRRAFVLRLNSYVEPIRLKIAILEFLSSAVETQPGLVELFLHQVANKTSSKPEEKQPGKFSCLPAIFTYLDKKKKGLSTLKLASLRFLNALWTNRRDSALAIIRARMSFWDDLVAPLVISGVEKLSIEEMDSWSLILQILMMETYYVSNEDFDSGFIEAMASMNSSSFHKRMPKIFGYKTEFEEQAPNKKEKLLVNTIQLIGSWKEFLIIGSVLHPTKTHLDKDSLKEEVLSDLTSALFTWTDHSHHLVIKELSSTLMLLSKRWDSCISEPNKIMTEILAAIKVVMNSSYLPVIVDHMFSTFLSIIQHSIVSDTHSKLDVGILLHLLPFICKILQTNQATSLINANQEHAEQTLKTLLLSLSLISTISKCLTNKRPLVNMLNDYSTMSYLMQTMKHCLKIQQHPNLINGILSLCLTFTEDIELGELIMTNGALQILIVDFNPADQNKTLADKGYEQNWCLALALVTAMLRSLGFRVLQETIDFVGAHREKIIQATSLTGRVYSAAILQESKEVSKLLMQLSCYWEKWKFMQPEVMVALQNEIMLMLQTTVAFLARPRLLTHIVESQDKDSVEALLERARAPSPSLSRDGSHSVLLKDDSIDRLSGPAGEVQGILINILANCTGMLRQMVPNILESILDEGMDLDSFNPLINLAFNSPSLDETSTVGFGTLVACANTCLRILQQITPTESPRSSPLREKTDPDLERFQSLRTTLNNIIDNSLIVMMSEASCYLRHPGLDPRTKQFLKRELGSEMTNFLYSLHRHMSRRSTPQTPKSSDRRSPLVYRRSPSKLGPVFADDEDSSIYKVADIYAKQLLL